MAAAAATSGSSSWSLGPPLMRTPTLSAPAGGISLPRRPPAGAVAAEQMGMVAVKKTFSGGASGAVHVMVGGPGAGSGFRPAGRMPICSAPPGSGSLSARRAAPTLNRRQTPLLRPETPNPNQHSQQHRIAQQRPSRVVTSPRPPSVDGASSTATSRSTSATAGAKSATVAESAAIGTSPSQPSEPSPQELPTGAQVQVVDAVPGPPQTPRPVTSVDPPKADTALVSPRVASSSGPLSPRPPSSDGGAATEVVEPVPPALTGHVPLTPTTEDSLTRSELQQLREVAVQSAGQDTSAAPCVREESGQQSSESDCSVSELLVERTGDGIGDLPPSAETAVKQGAASDLVIADGADFDGDGIMLVHSSHASVRNSPVTAGQLSPGMSFAAGASPAYTEPSIASPADRPRATPHGHISPGLSQSSGGTGSVFGGGAPQVNSSMSNYVLPRNVQLHGAGTLPMAVGFLGRGPFWTCGSTPHRTRQSSMRRNSLPATTAGASVGAVIGGLIRGRPAAPPASGGSPSSSSTAVVPLGDRALDLHSQIKSAIGNCVDMLASAVDLNVEAEPPEDELTTVVMETKEQRLQWRDFLSEAVSKCCANALFTSYDVEADPPSYATPQASMPGSVTLGRRAGARSPPHIIAPRGSGWTPLAVLRRPGVQTVTGGLELDAFSPGEGSWKPPQAQEKMPQGEGMWPPPAG
eukprot:TRINITY_DN41904_c0_g1_i3.p1 TRINITY_DN41904_c0_g1~~TRINITY_DN41904_c0_g1_i3.p1  ORF type:complete len:786 (+),score=103.90 TRINITY_DN41904_c0_g1_i3:274-2358(+)